MPLIKYLILKLTLTLLISNSLIAQNYTQRLTNERLLNKIALTEGNRAPLKSDELIYIRHFQPDSTWIIQGLVEFIGDTTTIPFQTSSGKIKYFEKRALIRFQRGNEEFRLTAYRNVKDRGNPESEASLFIPFTDRSNGDSTYEGGRYINASANDIKEGKLRIDFNRCYNPYCAYSSGFNCPVPPAENRLSIAIPVGEQAFAKPH
jgi:uncharacterized protein (DUF1684 family)